MLKLAALTATAIGLSACSGSEGTAPTITSFTATPTSVAAGGTTMFAWVVDGADKITITGGSDSLESTDASGSATSGAINADTTYTLTAENADGSNTATVDITVTVAGGPTVDSFAANPTSIMAGESSDLTWMTTDATTVNITAAGAMIVMDGAADGSFTVMPDVETTYTLIASDADGNTSTPSTVTVTVNVTTPTVRAFAANPTAVDPGAATTLSWDVINANSIIVTDDQANEVYNGTDLIGSAMDSPTQDTTYTITITDGTDTVTDTVTVTVNPPMGAMITSFTASPMMAVEGQNVDLAWATTDANSIEISDGNTVVHTSTAGSGSTTVVMGTADVTYTLTALNPAGDATAMITVTFAMAAPVINAFDASPNPGPLGGLTTLSWDVAAATTIDINDGNGTPVLTGTTAAAGTFAVTLTGPSNDFTLIATNQFGNVMQTINVVADNGAPTIVDFTVSPDIGADPLMVTISYDVQQARTLEVLANGVPLAATPFVPDGTPQDVADTFMVTLNVSTNIELVVGNGAGTDTDNASVVVVPPGGLEMEPNDTATGAQSLAGMTPQIAGTISVGTDEDWYTVVVPANGFVRAQTSDGSGGCALDTILTFFDIDGTTQLATNDDIGGGNRCSLLEPSFNPALTNLPAGTYYIQVESFNTGTGNYVLDVTVGAPGCGNTVLEAGEQCDDGNTTAGDQCDATCQLEPDQTYNAPGAAATLTTNITNAGDVVIVEVVVASTSYLRAETFEVASSTTCDNADSELILIDDTATVVGSDDFDGVGSCSRINENDGFARLDPGSYFLLVTEDNSDAAIAAMELVIEGVAADVCGNTVVEAGNGENCDDGNLMDGDGCSALCQDETAQAYTAPGAQVILQTPIVNAGDQPIVTITVTADTYLLAETLVDSVAGTCGVDTIITVRDSGGVQALRDDDDGVGACSLLDANDGILTAGTYTLTVEEFGNNSAIPVLDLILEGLAANVCGNGVVDGVNEVCDDGNLVAGDGCDALCQSEAPPPTLETEPNDSLQTANSTGLTGPGSITFDASISVAGDVDFFSFVVPAGGGTLDARTYGTIGNVNTCNGDTVMFLEDSTGTQVATDDDGGTSTCSSLAAQVLAAGTYYVRIIEFGNNGTVDYFLDVTLQ